MRRSTVHHLIGVSDLVELWVIEIQKPMILCARSTSRSNEPSKKRRSRSENTRKVCLFYRAFSCDVIAAMLEGKNNTFSLHWEMIYFQLFQPSNMAAVKTLYIQNNKIV